MSFIPVRNELNSNKKGIKQNSSKIGLLIKRQEMTFVMKTRK